MSKLLSIDVEWLDQPAASDPLERASWAAIQIQSQGRAITRVWDRQTNCERTSIYVPAFPLVEWIVENWWSLLFEPKLSDEIPSQSLPRFKEWIQRHCLRAAESGLLLPRLFIYGDGDFVTLEWSEDHRGDFPSMNAEFVGTGSLSMRRPELCDVLRAFVQAVLDRVAARSEASVSRLKDCWEAIQQQSADEISFCEFAGRLGLDPYSVDTWDPSIRKFLEEKNETEFHGSLFVDLLESSEPSGEIPSVWDWVRQISISNPLLANSFPGAPTRFEYDFAAKMGYRTASELRKGIGKQSGYLSIEDAANAAQILPLRFVAHNHLPGHAVKAVVGWQSIQQPLAIGPPSLRSDNQRFLEARALFLAMYGCETGPRLATTGHTYLQKASRAFAAELLAPRSDIVAEIGLVGLNFDDANLKIEQLAKKYEVSDRVIELQLHNAGISVVE